MLYPSINEIRKKVDSRYTLVILAAKRSRDIIDGMPKLTEADVEKPVSIAANETADEAYKKGVEMTLTELVKILDALGVKPFGEAGETFDPQRHNAVMHIEDESLGENVIAEVFQTGFAHGDKVIRFAMVKVAN